MPWIDRALLQKLKGEKQKSAKDTSFPMNRPFPNYLWTQFQNESWCSFHVSYDNKFSLTCELNSFV